MGYLYDVMYYDRDGIAQAEFDRGVGSGYIDRMVGRRSSDGTYAVAQNTNWDGHVRCIDPSGREIDWEQLPWVPAD